MPSAIITDIGLAKLALASGSGSQVAITHVALGDGGGANYAPLPNRVALVNERARRAVDIRQHLAPNMWRVKVTFPPETAAFEVREMGFFDAGGALIALWAGLDLDPRRTGVISYLINHVLDFRRTETGVVIVEAPDDLLFTHMVQNIETHAIVSDEQFKQRVMLHELMADD